MTARYPKTMPLSIREVRSKNPSRKISNGTLHTGNVNLGSDIPTRPPLPHLKSPYSPRNVNHPILHSPPSSLSTRRPLAKLHSRTIAPRA